MDGTSFTLDYTKEKNKPKNYSDMIPQFEEFLYPFLLALKDGNLTTKEMRAKMVEHFKLTAEDCATLTKGGELLSTF